MKKLIAAALVIAGLLSAELGIAGPVHIHSGGCRLSSEKSVLSRNFTVVMHGFDLRPIYKSSESK